MTDYDDEDMADLFSFGSGDHGGGSDIATDVPVNSPPVPLSAAPFRSSSDEEFLDLLEDSPDLLSGPSLGDGNAGGTHDAETQEILDWLDDEKPTSTDSTEDEKMTELSKGGSNTTHENATSAKSNPTRPIVPTETVVTLPPVFKSLTAALASSQATVGQVRILAAEQPDQITNLNRPDLYCRLLTGKPLQTIQKQSSLVDSFNTWQGSEARKDELPSSALGETCEALANRVAESLEKTHATHRDKEDCRQDLLDVLQYHFRGQPKSGDQDSQSVDLFLPPVAATLLGFGLPAPVTSGLLQQITGQHMPLLALQDTERWEAAQGLHQHLYWLACYHLPLLVFHLDRYWPGWCGPLMPGEASSDKAPQRGKQRGLIPPSWLVSLLAGDTTFLPVTWMGPVWDWMLTAQDRFVPFFLTLAVLERAADDLILLTGEDLQEGFQTAFDFDQTSDWIEHWNQAGQALQTATPTSVLDQLAKAEDEAVQQALTRRQERAEAALHERLEAEKQAHMEQQERKADEARRRLNRARLVAFYRTHAPDKEGNIDQILENYGDRLEVLDAKLFKKYGVSFNPAIKEKPKVPPKSRGPNMLLASMNSKRNPSKEGDEKVSVEHIEAPAASKTEQVSVLVKADEVLPVICWSKEAAAMRGANRRSRKTDTSRVPLKFFLVDGRSEEVAEEQGRFPTAINLSPETMLDPEKLQKAEERFESLRGAIHVVVMGEGFSAIPKLYDQKLSSQMEEAMKQDESQTNICALFFFKKGFPFVSILDGGFAAAHSWLVREGPNHHLDVSSVLVDYDAEKSVFGQMEKLHTASATEKASRAMQNLMEKSIVAMTLQARNFERLASDMEQGKGRFGMSFLTKRSKSQSLGTDNSKSNDENKGPRFVNPFANKSNDVAGSIDQGPRFGNMFGRPKSGEDDTESNPLKGAPSSEEASNTGVTSFRNPFARKQESEGEKPVEQEIVGQPTSSQTATTNNDAKSGMANPFKGLGAAINNTVNRNSEGSAAATENQPGDNIAGVPNPFKGLGAKLNNTINRNDESVGAESTPTAGTSAATDSGTEDANKEKRNMFVSFGAVFNNPTKTEEKNTSTTGQGGPSAVPNMLKHNPFRGFGGAGTKKVPEDNKKLGSGFGGGFNSLRTFGRRPDAKDQSNASGGNESITFN